MAGGLTHTRTCELVIQNSLVPGASALSNFPVLLTQATLPSEMFDSDGTNPAQNGGGDIRFTSDSAGTTLLNCEVVSFVTNANPALGTAEIWVKVPSVSASVNTPIYVWYNTAGADTQPAVTASGGRNGVWADYLAVLHLREAGNGTTGEYLDSTGNGYDATGGGGTATPVQTTTNHPWGGTWQDFDGSNDVITVPTGSAMNASYISVQAMTRIDTAPLVDEGLISNRWSTQGNNYYQITPKPASSTATDYWYALTTSAAGITGYLNGASDNTYIVVTGNQFTTTLDTRIGTYFDGSANRSLDANIGEARIRLSTLSSDWITAEYNNQNDPATFVIEGTPAAVGGGGGDFISASTAPATSAVTGLAGSLSVSSNFTGISVAAALATITGQVGAITTSQDFISASAAPTTVTVSGLVGSLSSDSNFIGTSSAPATSNITGLAGSITVSSAGNFVAESSAPATVNITGLAGSLSATSNFVGTSTASATAAITGLTGNLSLGTNFVGTSEAAATSFVTGLAGNIFNTSNFVGTSTGAATNTVTGLSGSLLLGDLVTLADLQAQIAALSVIVNNIKIQTDQLTFSAAGYNNVNIKEVADNGGLVGDGAITPVGRAP